MSEYMERHTISRLIGAPPGYVGFDQGGLLTDGVDQHPHCVVLLDEIEKAHPDLFNILLQVMDHGKLTDHNGKSVDFRNVILIMTSNVGAQELSKSPIGFGRKREQGDDEEAINRMFTPEFRNRLDAIISFAPLPPAVVRQVVEKFVLQLEGQLAERGVTIELTPEAAEWLAIVRAATTNAWVARPLVIASSRVSARQKAAGRSGAVRRAGQWRLGDGSSGWCRSRCQTRTDRHPAAPGPAQGHLRPQDHGRSLEEGAEGRRDSRLLATSVLMVSLSNHEGTGWDLLRAGSDPGLCSEERAMTDATAEKSRSPGQVACAPARRHGDCCGRSAAHIRSCSAGLRSALERHRRASSKAWTASRPAGDRLRPGRSSPWSSTPRMNWSASTAISIFW